MLPCLNKQLLGVECPGCGMQRSVSLLLHGEFIDAFLMYPAIYTLIPLLILITLDKVLNYSVNNKFIIFFSIASVTLILGNYILKLIN